MKKILYYIKRLFNMDYSAMFKTIDKVHQRSGKPKISIFFDMISCSAKYQAGYTDYFLFYFEDLTDEERATYVTRGVNDRYILTMNDKDYYHIFRNRIHI